MPSNKNEQSQPEPAKIDRTLLPETEEQRNREVRIGEADIAECEARMGALKSPGRILDQDGDMITVPANVTRAMLDAERLVSE